MIAIGDSYPFMSRSASTFDSYFRLGGAEMIVGPGLLGWEYGRNPGWFQATDVKPVLNAIAGRHTSQFNLAFCDGHVEGVANNKLFERNERAMKRWNTDNEAHIDLTRP
jgi:prepilin-type processing-associated H-X9-DG protein